MRIPKHLLRDQITIKRYLGTNGRGEDLFAPAYNTKANVNYAKGTGDKPSVQLVLSTDDPVTRDTRITIGDHEYTVQNFQYANSITGPTHIEVSAT